MDAIVVHDIQFCFKVLNSLQFFYYFAFSQRIETKTAVKVGSRVLSYAGQIVGDQLSSVSKWLKEVQRMTNWSHRIWGHEQKGRVAEGQSLEELLGEYPEGGREGTQLCQSCLLAHGEAPVLSMSKFILVAGVSFRAKFKQWNLSCQTHQFIRTNESGIRVL